LEDGRFIIINVSPVITKRPGREFESTRYPIHYDFHKILTETGFYFIDEIVWIKPETTVKNRNGGYQQTRMPLSYKPNTVTESLMVYRKDAPFLLDKNINQYGKSFANSELFVDTTNCWYINPKSDRAHPAVFPEELCKKVLKYYSFRTDVVMDPFAGSGTFGNVALKMGRIPLLCEINEDYCDIIRQINYNEL
jgi:DNA modification methylase